MNSTIPVELVGQSVRKLKYSVLVDMDNNGVYEVDITDDCIIDYINTDLELKNPGEVLGKPSTSNASITLFNEKTDAHDAGYYSPNNANNIESEHTGKFRRNTKVRILGGFIDSENVEHTMVLFDGVITNLKNSVRNNDKKIVLTLKDMAKFLQKKKNPNRSYTNSKYYESVLFDSTISEAVEYLLDYALGENYPRSINHLSIRYPVIEFPVDQNIWTTLQKLAEACGAYMYFEQGTFKFYTQTSAEFTQQSVSQYTFNADNIFDLTESIDEENIVNRWQIESNGKTLQPRQVLVGTPTVNVISTVEEYKTGDGKNAVNLNVITLKSQADNGIDWIDTINVPMVDTTTYSDLLEPTQDDVNSMNTNSIVKVWDKIRNVQLTIQDINVNAGTITLREDVGSPYSIQVSYQHYVDRIICGKYRDYEFSFGKMARNIEMPEIEAHNGYDVVNYSTQTPTDNLYLTNWEVLDGNQRVKFRLVNNISVKTVANQTLDTIYINKFLIYGNPLDCVTPLKVIAEDAATLSEFENSYNISNDYIIDSTWARQVADYYLYRTKSDKSFIDITTKGIPQSELLDRVTLNETTTGISNDFIIIGIKQVPRIDGWKTTLSLESLKPTWTYDKNNTSVIYPYYDNGAILTLPEINISSTGTFEDVFENNTIKHSVVINFVSPAQLNISDFIESKILYQEYDEDSTSWGRYITCGSFNDSYVTSYKITGLLPDKQYKIYVVAANKLNQQSPYGNGYIINTPTTAELQATYGLLSAPTNVHLSKGLNQKLTVSCAPCSYHHYKTTRYQFVADGLGWTDPSVQSQDVNSNSYVFEFPDESNYKVRVAYVDIWDRVGTWSSDYSVSGGKISESDLSSSLLEVVISSNVTPSSGDINNLIDGTDASVVFSEASAITYKYPYESIFDAIRVRVPDATTMYAEIKDVDGNWQYVVGTNSSPVNLIGATGDDDANVFAFHVGGDMESGAKTRKRTKEVRITFPLATTINELLVTTFQYLDTLIVGNGIQIGEHVLINNAGIKSINGNDEQFRIDALTGSAYFGGTVKAGIIQCESFDSRLNALFNSFGHACIIPGLDGSYGLQILSGTSTRQYWLTADMNYETNPSPGEATGSWGTTRTYGYIRWPISSANIQGTITSAYIQLFCSELVNPTNLLVNRVTSSWSESSANPSSTLAFTETAPTNNAFYTISDPALNDMVQNWISGSYTNYGIRLAVPDRSNMSASFCGRTNPDAAKRPLLYITTNNVPDNNTVRVSPGFCRIGSIVYHISQQLQIVCPNSSGEWRYVVLTVNPITLDATLSLQTTNVLPANSIMVGRVKSDGNLITSIEMSRESGRRDGSVSSIAMGVGGDYFANSPVKAPGIWIGSWKSLSAGGSATWAHSLGSSVISIYGQYRINSSSPVRNIMPISYDYYNSTAYYFGVDIVQDTANSVTFYGGNYIHIDYPGKTLRTSGEVRPIIYVAYD